MTWNRGVEGFVAPEIDPKRFGTFEEQMRWPRFARNVVGDNQC